MIPAYSRINPNRKASTLPAHKDLYIRVNGHRLPIFITHRADTAKKFCLACPDREVLRKRGTGFLEKCGWYGDQLKTDHGNKLRCDECLEPGRPGEEKSK